MLRKPCPCTVGQERCASCILASAAVTTLLGGEAPDAHPLGMDKGPHLNCERCMNGYTVSERLEDWLEAAFSIDGIVEFDRNVDGSVHCGIGTPSRNDAGEGDTPIAAIAAALEGKG